MNNIKQAIKYILSTYTRIVCKKEFLGQKFYSFNERPVELSFLFSKLSEAYPKTVLDVGTGTTALPHMMRNCGFVVTSIDNIDDYWPLGMFNRHYYVISDDITKTKLKEKYDFISCISVLEHIKNYDKAVNSMSALLKPGGHLVLTFPYNESEYKNNVYGLEGSSYGQDAPYVTQAFSKNEIERWCQDSQISVIEQQYWDFWTGDYWTVGEQIIPPRKSSPDDKHQLSCILFQKECAI